MFLCVSPQNNELEPWLYDLYRQKEALLEHFHRCGHFPDAVADLPGRRWRDVSSVLLYCAFMGALALPFVFAPVPLVVALGGMTLLMVSWTCWGTKGWGDVEADLCARDRKATAQPSECQPAASVATGTNAGGGSSITVAVAVAVATAEEEAPSAMPLEDCGGELDVALV